MKMNKNKMWVLKKWKVNLNNKSWLSNLNKIRLIEKKHKIE